jgi:hypothetical protein
VTVDSVSMENFRAQFQHYRAPSLQELLKTLGKFLTRSARTKRQSKTLFVSGRMSSFISVLTFHRYLHALGVRYPGANQLDTAIS